jgi:hypothetical protein
LGNVEYDNQFKADLEEDRRRLNEIKSQVAEAGRNVYTYLLGFDKKGDPNFEIQNQEFQKEYLTLTNNNE